MPVLREGNLNAGNVGFALSELSGFRIKRRKITDFNWVTLSFVPIADVSQLEFIFNDNLAASLEDYEYVSSLLSMGWRAIT